MVILGDDKSGGIQKRVSDCDKMVLFHAIICGDNLTTAVSLHENSAR